MAHDPERDWVIDETVDHAAAALDEAKEEYERGKNDTKGLRLVVMPKPAPKKPEPDLPDIDE